MQPTTQIIPIPAPDCGYRQKGVGLIEVLVAALIMAVGILGLVAMQLKSVQTSGTSQARVQATAIAQDLIERITMNDSSMLQSSNGYGPTLSAGTYVSTPSSLPETCLSGNCTPEETVTFDINQAAYYAGTLLPEGLLSGRIASSGSNNLQVFVAWGGTKPTIGTGDDACMESAADGTLSYRPDANCVMLEATFQ